MVSSHSLSYRIVTFRSYVFTIFSHALWYILNLDMTLPRLLKRILSIFPTYGGFWNVVRTLFVVSLAEIMHYSDWSCILSVLFLFFQASNVYYKIIDWLLFPKISLGLRWCWSSFHYGNCLGVASISYSEYRYGLDSIQYVAYHLRYIWCGFPIFESLDFNNFNQ